jgi:hypothetical protein
MPVHANLNFELELEVSTVPLAAWHAGSGSLLGEGRLGLRVLESESVPLAVPSDSESEDHRAGRCAGFGLLRQPECQCQLPAPTGNFKLPVLIVLLLKGPGGPARS